MIQRSRVPIVVLDRDLPFPADTVYSEDRSSIRDVVRYLARLGHQRIGLITCPLHTRPGGCDIRRSTTPSPRPACARTPR